MSRYTVTHDDKALAFGTDHVCGDFLIIWSRPADNTPRLEQDEMGPDPDEILVDEDNSTNLTRQRMLLLLDVHGFTLDELHSSMMHQSGRR